MGADAAGLVLSRLEQHGASFGTARRLRRQQQTRAPGVSLLSRPHMLVLAGVLLLGMWGEGSGAARGWDMRPRLKEGGGSAR